MNSPRSTTAIFSPASADGRARCDSPDGPPPDLFGPDHVPASRSRPPGESARLTTLVTCGPLGDASSANAALVSSLANKLSVAMLRRGSTLYRLTWAPWDTPSPACHSRLRASAHRTRANGFTGWLSPQASDANGSGPNQNTRCLDKLVRGEGHPHPCLIHGSGRNGSNARTACAGLLNPAFTRWLMGYPVAWDDCAATAMQLSRNRRRHSSAPPST